MRAIILRNINRITIAIILLVFIIGFIEEDAFIIALVLMIPFGAIQVIISLILIPIIKNMKEKLKFSLYIYYFIVFGYLFFFRLIDLSNEFFLVIPICLAILLTIILEANSRKLK